MKIGVISDTHLQNPGSKLYDLMDGIFSDVSMILHAGDLTSLTVLDAFSGRDVVAVCGNMDRYPVPQTLPAKEVIKVNGFRIGLIHGWGSHFGLEEKVRTSFNNVDAIVYGHTHKPANHVINGILMFNPGAFSGSSLRKKAGSVGILNIEKEIIGTIVDV